MTTNSSSDINQKSQLFDSQLDLRIKEIITHNDLNIQTGFISIYPLLKLNKCLYTLWKITFEEICDKMFKQCGYIDTDTKDMKDIKNIKEIIIINKLNAMRFIELFIKIEPNNELINELINDFLQSYKWDNEWKKRLNTLLIISNKNIPEIPILQTPILQTPILQTPILQTPILQTPRSSRLSMSKSINNNLIGSNLIGRIEYIKSGDNPNMWEEVELPCSFEALDPKDCANTLTAQCNDYMKNLTVRELVNNIFLDQHVNNPNINGLTNMFQKISFWVPTEIINTTDKNIQLKRLKTFIDMAKMCEKLHNYHILMAILGGLNNSAVTKLKYLWDSLKREYTAKYDSLNTLMSVLKSFENYRNRLKSIIKEKEINREVNNEINIIPFTGVYNRDMLLIMENKLYNPDNVTFDTYYIEIVGKIMNQFISCFGITNNNNISSYVTVYLDNATVWDEKTLWEKSNTMLENMPIIKRTRSKRTLSRYIHLSQSQPVFSSPSITQSVTQTVIQSVTQSPVVNTDYNTWTVEQVSEWLNRIGFSQYAEIFVEQQITGSILGEITEQGMYKYLGIKCYGHRLMLLKHIQTLKIK
jgi:hypothetical protein